MSYLCRNCFQDSEIIGFIISKSYSGNCSFCGSENIECVSFEDLFEFFFELSENFKIDLNGKPLVELIQDKWNFFSKTEIGIRILNSYLTYTQSSIANAMELVNFSDEILDNVNYWDILRKTLIEKNRYITDVKYLREDLKWETLLGSKYLLDRHQKLYRARLHANKDEKAFSKKKMYSPPKENSTAGRANPSGIPYLYLCDNDETVLYEIRSFFLDEVSIGTFLLSKDIKENVYINDFTEIPSIYKEGEEIQNAIITTLLKEKISLELSKPLRRYDSELEYIPTQFICEFIKEFTEVKGIKFKSSLHDKGNNIVIFEQDVLDCIKVNKVKVSNVEIKSDNY